MLVTSIINIKCSVKMYFYKKNKCAINTKKNDKIEKKKLLLFKKNVDIINNKML